MPKTLDIQKIFEDFYKKTTNYGTIDRVPQVSSVGLYQTPNLCNESCRQDLLRFIERGLVTPTLRCSAENPPQPRVRDGFFEPSCLWARVYHDVARAPVELETFRRHASELMDSALKPPVLSLPVGTEVWIPTLNSALIH